MQPITQRWPLYLTVLYVVCLYGGYFGAGAGIVYFAIVVMLTRHPWQRAVLMKTVLLSVSNLAASLLFVALAPVDWLAARSEEHTSELQIGRAHV